MNFNMGMGGPSPVNPGLLQGRGFQMPPLPTPQAGSVSPLHAAPQGASGFAALFQNPEFLKMLPDLLGSQQGPNVPPPAMMAAGGNPQYMAPPAAFTRPGPGLFGAY